MMGQIELSESDKKKIDEVFEKERQKEKAWFKSWGFEGSIVIAAGLAYKEFLEKETRYNPHNFYKSPLARKSYMLGWMRGRDV